MDHGLKIAKTGHPVKTAGIKDLIFTSAYPLLKIKELGTGSINFTNDSGFAVDELVFEHNLGYRPLFSFLTQWYDIDSAIKQNDYRDAPFIDTLVGGANYFDAKPYVTTTELRYNVASFDGNGGTYTLNYIYAIYYDQDEV